MFSRQSPVSGRRGSTEHRLLSRLAEGQKKLLPVTVSRPTTVAILLPCGIRLEVPAHSLEDILPVLTRSVLEKT